MSEFLPRFKYLITLKFEVDGIVEEHDVIGAIFGQTEGLFGSELNLGKLCEEDRIGRIKVDLRVEGGKTIGDIKVPSALNRVSTALLAATLESIERVGPFPCRAKLDKIIDIREEKKKQIVKRARELLQEWNSRLEEEVAEFRKMLEKPPELILYGPDMLPAGPDVEKSDSIILVEGRADVLRLLSCGYTNVIATGGANIPETIVKLCKGKKVIAFLDGDRSADLILKELLQKVHVDFVARAPKGKEVEQLTAKEISEALKAKTPISSEILERVIPEEVKSIFLKLKGTLQAALLDEKLNQIAIVPVINLIGELEKAKGVHTLVLDGILIPKVVELALRKGVKRIIARRVSAHVKRPFPIEILTIPD